MELRTSWVTVVRFIRWAVALLMLVGASLPALDAAPLEHAGTISMPGVKGRIDHFAMDVQAHRLFVAALGNDTVEVIDTAARRHEKTISGFGEPQGLAYVSSPGLLFVANGRADRVDVLKGETLDVVRRIGNLSDADNLRFDPASQQIIVGYGGGALRFMDVADPASGRDIRLHGHPESFQLEKAGARVYVNVPDARSVEVVDRVKGKIIATWQVPGARSNFPMALDEAGRRLFVGARSPAVLLVYNTDSGKVVATVAIGGDTDDIFFDQERRRIYVVCGEGRIDVFRQQSPDKYELEMSVSSAPRARTGLFVPEERLLYVAAPALENLPARILIYEAR